jgi:Sec-independent protein translocase protein TatA
VHTGATGTGIIVKRRLLALRIAAFAPPHYDEAMSFSDTIFLFFLALILFGPKKLPEMARQAGKLLAELRRASNEFKSQIETEIAHLEVQKIPPPNPPPQGTVATLSGRQAASEPAPHELPATLAAPAAEAVPPVVNSAESNADASLTPTPSVAPAAEPGLSVSQEPHV